MGRNEEQMTDYLKVSYDYYQSNIVESYDDAPMWSFPPGKLLLDNLHLKQNSTVVDIGCGTGFPLMVLAERYGPKSTIYGVDIWKSALRIAQKKIDARGINHVHLIESSASKIPLPDNHVDLITSNLGINNFADENEVIKECFRILKPGGKLLLTSNLVETFKEFYNVLLQVANNLEKNEYLNKINAHIQDRATIKGTIHLFEKLNLTHVKTVEDQYIMKYANGTAFLNDYFIIMAFLPSWKKLFPLENLDRIFSAIEKQLNELSAQAGHLNLTVPFALFEFIKK